MYQIVLTTLQQNPQLKVFLLATGQTKILEGNPNDNRRGVEALIYLTQINGWEKTG